MNIISIVAIGAIGSILAVIIKQYKPELAIFTSIITAVIILSYVISIALPIVTELKSMLNNTNISPEYLSILLKSVGICYLTQFVCDICKESGQMAIANKIEIAGRAAICLLSLPLFHDLINIIETIIGKVT